MIIYDTLSNLESYIGLIDNLQHVIDTLDRSLPYKETNNRCKVEELTLLEYEVESFITSEKGQDCKNSKAVLILVLDGEEIISCDDNVFYLREGTFLYLDRNYKKGQCNGLATSIKDCTFYL